MRSKTLFAFQYRVVALLDRDTCPAKDFLLHGEASTLAHRLGLLRKVRHVSEVGLHRAGADWCHEVDKAHGIYEFISGDLRLFFFKGKLGDVVVCTSGLRKKGRKVDAQAVARAVRWKASYLQAIKDKTYEVIES